MDKRAAKYGTLLHIPELDEKYRAQLQAAGLDHIPFRVVDTGGAFRHKGTSRIDICTGSRRDTHDASVNGRLTLEFPEGRGAGMDSSPRQRQRHQKPEYAPPEAYRARYQSNAGSMPSLSPVADDGVTSRVPGALYIGQGDKWLSPEAAYAFVRARDILQERYGINLKANDHNGAGRSYRDQQDIWNRHLRGLVSAAARPGHSNHERGNSVDFANLVVPHERSRVQQVLREVGFVPGDHGKTIRNDEWHWTYQGAQRRRR